jgi:hypothetical protein
MWKRKWLWCAMAALPLLAAGAWAGVQALGDPREPATATAPANPCCDSVCPLCTPASPTAEGDCCADPGCSPDCPPNCLDLAAKTGSGGKANSSAKPACPPCPFCP